MAERQEAPSALEPVRLFLQTLSVPKDTRSPLDRLSSIEEANEFCQLYSESLATPPAALSKKDLSLLRDLRHDLRASLTADDDEWATNLLKPWFERVPITVELSIVSDGALVSYRYRGDRNALAGALLARVVEAISGGVWRRLKICPDCQTVFYDRTKNRNRVWCGMFAHGPDGRACGSIAKVRSWRQRQARDATRRRADPLTK